MSDDDRASPPSELDRIFAAVEALASRRLPVPTKSEIRDHYDSMSDSGKRTTWAKQLADDFENYLNGEVPEEEEFYPADSWRD